MHVEEGGDDCKWQIIQNCNFKISYMNFRISSRNYIFTPKYLFSHRYSIRYFIPTRLMEIISELIHKIMNIEKKNKEFEMGIHRCQELPQWSRDAGLAGRLESGRLLVWRDLRPRAWSCSPARGCCSRLWSACTGLFITGSDTTFLSSPHPALSAPA